VRPRGFTLLEVLVAISILGLALTVILSSQVGLFSSAQRARNLTVATSLSRCKMSEVEAKLLKQGYSLTDTREEGPCCEEEESAGFHCSWKVEKIELPEMADMDDGGSSSALSDGGPLSALLNMKNTLDFDGGIAALSGLTGSFGEGGVGGGLAPMLMGFVYPSLKPMLEASIRKLTVTVAWQEGSQDRTLDVVQFVTDPQQGGLDPNAAKLLQAGIDTLQQATGAGTPGANNPATTPRTTPGGLFPMGR
jgi:general secretion pathway protein I